MVYTYINNNRIICQLKYVKKRVIMAKIVTYYVGKDMIFYSYAISFLREKEV
ncbi:hypothetical protein B4134_3595 [Bacillus safensis]|nr:hypothetical protein B4134_3595 [Bacillus safensis]